MGVTRRIGTALLLAVAVAGASSTQVALAQGPADGLTLTAPITGIRVESAVSKPLGYNLDVTIANRGDETVRAQVRMVSGPEDWKAGLLHRVKEVFVKRILIGPGEENSDLRFHFEIPKGIENGTYDFRVGLFDDRDVLLSSLDYRVVVNLPPPAKRGLVTAAGRPLPEDVRLDPQYSHLTGPVGTAFTFRVNVKNRTSEEREFALVGAAPLGWSISFRPSFQSQQIGAITLRPNANQDLDARVTPPGTAQPGVYTITMTASTEEIEPAQITVQAELTGSPRLVLTTIDESNEATATAGESSEVKVILVNSGTGPAANVEMAAGAPEGWEARFDHNPVASIQPNEALELTMTLTPSDDAEAGDYNVDLTGSVPQSSAEFRFRVTVERSSAFGFLGIAVIVLVAGGLGALLLRLGRR